MLASLPTILHIEGVGKFTLKPTLATAIRLDRAFGNKGFAPIIEALKGESLSAINTILAEGGDVSGLQYLPDNALAVTLPQICVALIRFIVDLAMVELEPSFSKQPAVTADGETIALHSFYAELFGLATGCMGWTPSQAYDASPVEILVAYKARVKFVGDILKAAFGSSENDDSTVANGPLSGDLDRDGLHSLASLNGVR